MVDFVNKDPVSLPGDMVSISFSATDDERVLNDAIVIRQSQYDAMTPEDIQAEMQARWDSWIEAITRISEESPIVEEPPAEGMIDG